MGDEPAAKRMRLNEDEQAPPSPVLHVRNLPLDVTEFEIRQVFPNPQSIVGMVVLKGKNQAFVQFTDVQSSSYVLTYFQSQRAQIRHKQVYFQYSRRTELDNPAANSQAVIPGNVPYTGQMAQTGSMSRAGCVLHSYGTVTKIILMSKQANLGSTQALIQYADESMAVLARETLNGKQLFDGSGLLRVQTSKFETLKILYNNEQSRDFTQHLPYGPPGSVPPTQVATSFIGGNILGQPYGAGAVAPAAYRDQANSMAMMGMDVGGSPVVLANKLNEEKITTDALFNLFGVYGDVQRVKILFNKRHTAMVQMTNGQQAQLVVRMLNNVPLFGKPMALTISSHTQVKLPRPDSEEYNTKNTVSYEKSEFHRYAIVGSKNYNNIVPPSNFLHLSNIADGVTEEQLRQVFSQFGTVTSFRFFQNNNKMAIISMLNLGEAVDALVAMHQFPLVESNRLRVSFAKKGN